jgi:hypothetical protein
LRRNILLALVAALALAVCVNATASATAIGGDAQAAAKKKAGKKKAAKCPAKPKKGKKKAGKSLADSAAKKKKAAKCKAKPKKKAKAKTTPKTGAFKLTDGTYNGEDVHFTVTGGGTKVSTGFPVSCFLFSGEKVPLTASRDIATASETYTKPIAGVESKITWSLTVRPTLSYMLKTSWDVGGICTGQKTFSGKLVKAG